MVAQFTTIGHSNRSLAEFVTMLQNAGVDLVIDVRAFPRSRTNPEFNIDRLPDDLERRCGLDVSQVQFVQDYVDALTLDLEARLHEF